MKKFPVALLACGAASSALLSGSGALAQVRTFNLPSEEVAKSIPEFARQAGVQITAPVSQLHGVKTQAIAGQQDVHAALALLLHGTGLTIASDNGVVIVLRQVLSSAAQQGNRPIMLASNDAVVQTGPFNGPPPPPAERSGPVGSAIHDGPPADASSLVISGSRIIRNGYAAPTPMTVATADELTATTPSNIPEGLNKLPVFAGSSTSAGSTNAVAGGGGGVPSAFGGNYLDLRDLGPIRTLILVDGRRVPPTALSGQVDTNTLPQMLVQRVDVVTGGASAVYGSDAVTGVVNFILDKRFTGLKVEAQYGDSNYGDDESYKIGVAGGGDVLGHGHFIWSAEEYKSNGVSSVLDRPWSSNDAVTVGAGTVASPDMVVNNGRVNNETLGGLATSGPFKNQQFTSTGALAPFNVGTPTATSTVNIGGDGAAYQGLPLLAPIQTDQVFGRFQYDFAFGITGYVQASASQENTTDNSKTDGTNLAATIYSGNAFLTPAEQAQLTSAGASNFTLSRLIGEDQGGLADLHELTSNVVVTAGLTGKVFNNFVWDAYYTHGESIIRSRDTDNINYPHLFAALDAVNGPSGPVCQVSTTANASLYPGCVPINLFGANNASPQALAYVLGTTQWQGVNTMDDYAASLSGDAFNDWAGPVSTAFNVEYRTQSLSQTTNANPVILPSFVGLRPEVSPNKFPASIWPYVTQAPQQASDSVWEVSGETVVPLLKDMAFAKNLDVNGAVRYTDYSTSGSAVTWKIGFNYQPIEDLRFRVTQSRDIRAPGLLDLYSGETVAQVSVNDPHTGVVAIIPTIGGGNPNLVPEVSDTTTAGFVYSPSWLPRFRASVDYYNININNAIGSINGGSAAILQQCDASNGTASVCSSIIRPLPFSNTTAANAPTSTTNLPQNIAQVYTHGVDFEASYNFMLGDVIKNAPGRFDLRVLYSYQPVLTSVAYQGAQPTQLAGVAGVSADRVQTTVEYRVGPFSVDWEMRWLSSQNLSGTPLTVYVGSPLPAIFYHDINLTYRFKAAGHDSQLYFVVDNLLNQFPGTTGSAPTFIGGASPVGGDDVIGRYLTLGLRMQY